MHLRCGVEAKNIDGVPISPVVRVDANLQEEEEEEEASERVGG
jgi:hypothetical protein